MRYSAHLSVTDEETLLKNGDIDRDGEYTAGDSRLNLRIWNGIVRKGYRHNEELSNGDVNKKVYKKNNPVIVKNDDEIKFYITLKNTGQDTIKVKKISDSYIYEKDKIELELDTTFGIIKDSKITKQNTYSEYKYFELELPSYVKIEPGQEYSFIMKFKVKISDEYKSLENILYNKARVLEIEDTAGNKVEDADGTDNNFDMDFLKSNKEYDVSLQKYVRKVTYANKTVKYESDERSNMQTCKDESASEANKIIKKGATLGSGYKKEDTVKIETGDLVTYRVYVYNNMDYKVKRIKVKDVLPYYMEDMERKTAITIEKITMGPSEIDVTSDWKEEEEGSITYTISEISKNGEVYFDITYKFNIKLTGILTNTAYVLSSTGTYRTLDRDYVEMNNNDYGVSLEKYVTAVTNNENESISYNNRVNYRYNSSLSTSDGSSNKKTYKKNTPVVVDVGDIVTYTIKLTNTKNNIIRVTEIDDVFDENNNADLIYINESAAGYGSSINVSSTKGKLKLTISNPTDIEAGQSKYLTLKFRVDIPVENMNIPQVLVNTAKVTQIKNKNNIVVADNDTDKAANNQDSDWVETNVYKVSLEKYVTKVNGDSLTTVDNCTNIDRENKPIYGSDMVKTVKQNDPVRLEVGDIVTYTIKLTNEGDTAVKVKELYDCYDGNDNANIEYKVNSVTGYGTATVTGDHGDKTITITNPPEIAPGESKYFTIEFEVVVARENTGVEQVLQNTIEIRTLANKNDVQVNNSITNNRHKDSDWIKTKVYQVKLEKYVTAVNGANLINDTNNLSYNCNTVDRNNKPIYGSDTVKNIKKNDPVKLEVGDTVTYTIKLTNTGDSELNYGAINNLVVTDNCPDGLTFLNSTDVTRNSSNNTFTYEGTLEVGKSATFTITYSVTDSAKDIKDPIENTATVSTSFKNKNDKDVTDSDGTPNNTDKDWIKIKKIAVSLEKYVSAINGENIANRSGIAEYLTIEDGKFVDKTEDDSTWTRHNTTKYDNPVTVKQGDHVTYTIKVKNDGESQVTVNNITDTLPSFGISKYKTGGYSTNGSDYRGVTDDRTVYLKRSAAILLKPGESTTVLITVIVSEPNESVRILANNAEVTGFVNKNGISVNDTTPCNNKDNDYVQLDNGGDEDPYYTSVSVEKEWVNNHNKTIPDSIKVQLYRNGAKVDSEVTLNKDNNWKYIWMKLEKYDSNEVEYIYTVREVNVPDGFVATYGGNDNKIIITNTTTPPPSGEKVSKTVKKEWLYDNNSEDRQTEITVQLYKNGAKEGSKVTLNANNNWTYTWNNLVKYDSDKNEYEYTIQEENIPTHYKVEYEKEGNTYIINNKYDAPDSPDVIIGGYVWNDIAFDKEQNDYNALLQSQEKKIEGIKVYLYRVGIDRPVATTNTNSTGYYGFSNSDIDKTVVTESHKQYIKAEKIFGTQRWSDTYYSYYVVFEYDGITYTSTPDGRSMEDIINSSKDYKVDSNAKEDNSNGKSGLTTRVNFNNSINPNSGIEYDTVNESGKIPQSIHKYTKAMQSSTNLINLGTLFKNKNYNDPKDLEVIKTLEDKLKYVGLGLRGRDIFDLELTSDVYNVKITVNKQQGEYEYGDGIKLRQEDLEPGLTTEDMANITSENSNTYVSRLDQNIRKSDFNVPSSYRNDPNDEANYQGVNAIEVTYKITVHNTSNTKGKATKITNYYDSKYTFKEAKDSNGRALTANDGESGTGYKSKIITTPGTMLAQAETMEIYVIYTLNKPIPTTLSGLTVDHEIPTFNMAEITEYQVEQVTDSRKYTIGLIDKDSAPGSVNKEKVRLTTTEGQNTATTGGNPTTVGYYFRGNELNKLKYEDDTYATPTLYFVLASETPPGGEDNNSRIIEGYVFEDETQVDPVTRIKTGNGKLDRGEVGVYGATVELIEVDSDGNNPNTRYTVHTDDASDIGKFKFTNVLPGYYIIKYHYGDTTDTVLLNTLKAGTNAKSYNGEDFQATNNTGKAGTEVKAGLYKLNDKVNFWYLYNESEGISTATDNTDRRNVVSTNVINFKNEEMVVLNNMRDGDTIEEAKVNNVIDKTKMYAQTPKMLITVEKSEIVENARGEKQEVQRKEFGEYKITNMNFGIAEVPVTKVGLEKRVNSFTITDSTGQNVIAKLARNGDDWDIDGDIYVIGDTLDVSIEDQKLQGARLQVTYDIISDINVEKNFDNTSPTVATIAGLADYIDNNLSYNENLGNNKDYWEVTTYDAIQEDFEEYGTNGSGEPHGVLDPEGNKYTTVIRAKAGNPILSATDKAIATITLEKVLSSTDSTIEQIVTSTIEPFVYNNTVEITKFNFENTEGSEENKQKDRIRTKEYRHIIIPGVQYDTATAEELVLHPPTGDSSISTVYYIIAAISLTVLAVGVFGIKKFVIKK